MKNNIKYPDIVRHNTTYPDIMKKNSRFFKKNVDTIRLTRENLCNLPDGELIVCVRENERT